MCAIPQLVSAPLNQDVIGRRKRASCYGYGRRGLDDSLQLQTAFFPFAQSEKKTKKKCTRGGSRGKRWNYARGD